MASWGWSSAVSLAVHTALILLCYRTIELRTWTPRDEPRLIRVVIGDPAPAAAAPLGSPAPSAVADAPANDAVTIATDDPPPVTRSVDTTVAPRRPADSRRARRPPAPKVVANAAAAVAGSAQGVADATGSDEDVDGIVDGAANGRGSAPQPIDHFMPEYPERARARGVEGRVLLSIVLDPTGRVEEDIRVLHSIPLLDDAAITAVRRWRFHPARDPNGRAVRARVEVPVQFVLH